MRPGRTENSITRGAAVVEMAVVLPLLLTLLFGIIEFGWLFMVSHTLASAAREGCRTAVLAGSTNTETHAKVDWFMQSAGISKGNYTTNIIHATSTDPTETVTVTVQYSKISLLNCYFMFTDFAMKGKAAMRKEGM